MNKIIYSHIFHKRFIPRENQFSYRGFQVLVDVKKLAQIKGISLNRWSLFSLFSKDHGYRIANVDISESYLSWVEDKLNLVGLKISGDIYLQTIPRIFGYAFNPVSFWYCYKGNYSAGELIAIICEVNNTFHENHNYILIPAVEGGMLRAKEFHVSPFYPRVGHYEFNFKKFNSAIKYFIDDKLEFLAQTSCYRAEELNFINLLKTFIRLPFFNLMVVYLIHWQALKLYIKKATFYTKPELHPNGDTYAPYRKSI